MERKWSYHKWWCCCCCGCCFQFWMAWAIGTVELWSSCARVIWTLVWSFILSAFIIYCSISGPRKVCVSWCASAFICRDMKVFYEPHASHIRLWIKHLSESCLHFPYHFLSHSIWHFDWNLPSLLIPIDSFFGVFHDKVPVPSTWNEYTVYATICYRTSTHSTQFPFTLKLLTKNSTKAYFTLDSPQFFYLPSCCVGISDVYCPLSIVHVWMWVFHVVLHIVVSFYWKIFFLLFMFYAFVSSI